MKVSFFKNILTPPTFDDENKNRQADLLHTILWVLMVVPFPYLLFVIFFSPNETSRALIQSITGETANIFLLYLLRRGHIKLAAFMQVIAFWLFFTITAVTGHGGGVRGEAYLLGYPLVIIITGTLLGERIALGMTMLSLFSGGCMFLAESQGWLNIGLSGSPLITWVMSLVVFPLSAILQYLSARTVKSALNRARASEERYKLISKVSTDYVFETVIDEQKGNHLSWVSGAFEKMTGYTFEEYKEAGGWVARVYPDDQEQDEKDMTSLAENRDVKSDIRTISKNGEIRWERISAHPIWDDNKNRLVGIVGAVQDVTETKKAEEILKETLIQQAAILNNIPDMAWLKDKDGYYIAVNEQFTKVAGRPAEKIIGKTDFEIWGADFAKIYRDDDLYVAQTKKRRHIEEKQQDYTGNEYWVETVKTPIFNNMGEVIGTTGIARDITERKQAEILEQRRRAALEKVVILGKYVTEAGDLQATIKKIWHGVHDDLGYDKLAIFIYNMERNSMDDTIGTDNNGLMQDHWDLWFPIRDGSAFSHLLEKPDGVYFTHNYDMENNIYEGHEMYGVKDFVSVAAWSGDKPVAVICADNSITKRPITDEQLEALRLFAGYAGLAIENARLHETIQSELAHKKSIIEELESKNAELERFTYTVSHDLKSPLVTINGFLGYLETDARAGQFDKLQKDVFRIRMAVDKMQGLLRDLLELSRIGRLINTPVAIPFSEVVKDALEIVQGQIKERGVFVEFQDHNVIVQGDKVRLVEVMQNLIDNAIKFMGEIPNPHIEIGSFLNESGETIFFVKDNGIGVAPEYHEKIFGLFNKLDSDSNGTGIGLTLVKRIIEVHGGRIWVTSKIGAGSTFYFTLAKVGDQPFNS